MIFQVRDDNKTRIFNAVAELPGDGSYKVEIVKIKKKRTITQNAALHKYFAMRSDKMNAAGYTQKKLVGEFKDGFDLPVTATMIKDIFREVGRAMFKKISTSDLTTVEIQKVYDAVEGRFSDVTGIFVEWPCNEPPPFGDK